MLHAVQLELTDAELAMLDGAEGAAAAMAMRIVVGVARATGAARLLEIESAHVDGCLFHGDAGLEFAEALQRAGGRVVVRTTLNVGSLDLLHPEMVKAGSELASKGRRLMDAYVALGCEPTWSCAPYQLSHRPAFGTHVAWAESNAIAFVNSVLGARSDRYGDFLDIAAAITGRVPLAGLHLDEHRRATMALDCTAVSRRLLEEDAAWPVLGAILGERAGMAVVALTGLPGDLTDRVTEDRLKALGATAAAAGGVALFHIVGVTPEAPTLDSVADEGARRHTIAITTADLRDARNRLSTATTDELDAVSLGTPHFSVDEFAALHDVLADGPPFASSIDFYVSTSRAVLAEATARGLVEPFERAGGRILTDTCTYVTPVMRANTRTVMTNSGKLAWYAPSNLGVNTVLASLSECVESARAGRVVRDEAIWS
jgi:predicted aconitase